MPALVKRTINLGSKPRVEWLRAHSLSKSEILGALSRMDRGEQVAPSPLAVDFAEWCDESEAMVFETLELAGAVARLLRQPSTMMMIWAEPRFTGEPPQAGQVTEVGTRRFVSPRRKCRRVDSPADGIERDWHQRAVNSGGQD